MAPRSFPMGANEPKDPKDPTDPNPFGHRPDLEQLAEEAVAELIASGHFPAFSGRLPPRTLHKLARSKQRPDDEALLEDIFAARMIALTKNEYVEEVRDEDFDAKVIAPSHHRPVLVDIYSDFCRPCNHVLPIVYQLAGKYRDHLTVVKINISTAVRFRETYLGPMQVTPSFLFFKQGESVRTSGRFARLLGQPAFVATTRARLEQRIRSILELRDAAP
jgi:thiol-disulfide isomerase/thioredoxin